MTSPAATASPLYRIESVESAVKATIRQVTSPAVRDVMWSAWQQAIADAAADSPDRMPWERESQATVITEDAALRAMVLVLESIADIGSRHRIRDVLALELEFTEAENTASGTLQHCQKCGRSYRARSAQSKFCRPACRSAAHKKRKRDQARESDHSPRPGAGSNA
jgi:hypothetical protein